MRGHEAVVHSVLEVFPAAAKAGVEASMDLLTRRLQTHERTAPMLSSLLQ